MVSRFINDIGAELNRELSAAGYVVPVSSTGPGQRRWLQGVNNYGAAALILGSIPMTAISPGAEDAGGNRMEMFQVFFNRALTSIREGRFNAPRVRGRLGAVHSGSQKDSEGKRKLPLFKRDDGRTPGLDSFTE